MRLHCSRSAPRLECSFWLVNCRSLRTSFLFAGSHLLASVFDGGYSCGCSPLLAEKKVTITVKRREAPLSTAMNHSEHNHSEHIDPQKSKAECSF